MDEGCKPQRELYRLQRNWTLGLKLSERNIEDTRDGKIRYFSVSYSILAFRSLPRVDLYGKLPGHMQPPNSNFRA